MDPEYKSYKYQPSSDSPSPKSESTLHKGRITVVAVLALAIISGLGYLGYSMQSSIKDLKAEKQTSAQKIGQLQEELSGLKGSSDDSAVSNDSSYLEVPQWGVKFKQVGDKLSYKIEKKDGIDYLMLTNSTGKNIVPDFCPDLGDALYLIAISRNTTGEDPRAQGAFADAKIGDYSYFIDESNGICSNSPEKEAQVRADLLRDAKTIQKI